MDDNQICKSSLVQEQLQPTEDSVPRSQGQPSNFVTQIHQHVKSITCEIKYLIRKTTSGV